ncbi:PepSY domain-containing protein [Novosphingobium profundi]|uniref:PepSY-associated TM helix domain-containing protein n=1 Tax=Novosphingobium profundi TaxID=1774954 RepID=UPI001BDA19F8|nr:PepSY-associated TM helix domain-containing protein [Novosphingobium profundi]MBT0668027.1 PepSY domain-containing protein [Novosphingobium profundi]
MTGREFWMAVHRYSGLAILVFLGFAALTGSLLVQMHPLDRWLNADLFAQERAPTAPSVAPLVAAFVRTHPEFAVRSFPLTVAADARIPVKVEAGEGAAGVDQVFLDRTTGALAGTRSTRAAFTRRGAAELLHDVHYTLLMGTGGRWFMGAMALVWLIGNLVGVYLTLPERGAFWAQWKRSWRFSFKSVFARQMLDFHRASGLWLLLPLTLLALTSVCLNFFSEGYGPLVERLVPERAQPLPASPATGPLDFPKAVAAAREVEQGLRGHWRPASVINDLNHGRIGVTLTESGTLSYDDLGPIYLYFEAASGRLVEVDDPYHGNANLAMYRWLYPVHSGHVAGVASEIAVFLLGLVVFAMCVTGIYLWWKKRPGRLRQRRRRKAGPRGRPEGSMT